MQGNRAVRWRDPRTDMTLRCWLFLSTSAERIRARSDGFRILLALRILPDVVHRPERNGSEDSPRAGFSTAPTFSLAGEGRPGHLGAATVQRSRPTDEPFPPPLPTSAEGGVGGVRFPG